MADNDITKKEQARRLLLEHFKKTGNVLSGHSIAKKIDGDARTFSRYSAEFREEVKLGPKTPQHRNAGLKPGESDDVCIESCFERRRLLKEIENLGKEIKRLNKEDLTTQQVKQYIFNLAETDVNSQVPDWVINIDAKHSQNVPTLLMSDVHYGEVVNPVQIFGVNKYNTQIAKRRIINLARNMIDLLQNHIKHGDYPGLVLLLAGDFLSGNIHDELVTTNEKPIMPALLELLNIMKWFIATLADAFGRLMIFGTAGGNHTRMTQKVPSKDKAYTNFDWLLYRLLERDFKDDRRINFFISDGDDVQFKILNHRYRMTHGDRFRGGTGFIGPFAPITRNETKKRSAAETYGQNYDTLVIGHFHQRMMLGKVNVNGSVVGYNEFAINNNFPYEPPQQAFWLTSAKRGITGSYPVFCEDSAIASDTVDWVSWNTMDQANFNEPNLNKTYG